VYIHACKSQPESEYADLLNKMSLKNAGVSKTILKRQNPVLIFFSERGSIFRQPLSIGSRFFPDGPDDVAGWTGSDISS